MSEWDKRFKTAFDISAADWRGCLRQDRKNLDQGSLYAMWADDLRCKFFIRGYDFHHLPQCAAVAASIVRRLAETGEMADDEIRQAMIRIRVNYSSQVDPEDVVNCSQNFKHRQIAQNVLSGVGET